MTYDPSWPDDDEFGPWYLPHTDRTYEERQHTSMKLAERRCRHCKTKFFGMPYPSECSREECQAANLIAGYTGYRIQTVAYGEV